MDTKKEQALTEQELLDLRDGMALDEMVKTSPGWAIINKMLTNVAYHSWVDPMGMSKDDWMFAELNAFHAANNAKQLLEEIAKMISRADYLNKVKHGEIERRNNLKF